MTLTSWMDFEHAPPRNWDRFEELCADLFQEEWQDAALVRHGRSGQAQNGVDIVGREGAVWPVGVQCKRKAVWPVAKVTTADLDAEVKEALAFRPPLKIFYLVSTAPDDQPLQEHARKITKLHEAQGLFRVEVLGWREVERRATRHPIVAAKHFGSFAPGGATPLLATWRAAGGKVLLEDCELRVAIRELIHDLRDQPGGRVVFRQQESEDLLFQIQQLQTLEQTLSRREAVLELRDRLKILRDREFEAIEGLKLLCAHKIVRDYTRVVWEADADIVVRAFLEQAIDLDRAIVNGLEKIRLFTPDQREDAYIALFVSGTTLKAIWDHWAAEREKYPGLEVKRVSELPRRVMLEFAIPAILRRIVHAVDEGTSLSDLERRNWFDWDQWRVQA